MNHPKSMFQLSGVHYNLYTLNVKSSALNFKTLSPKPWLKNPKPQKGAARLPDAEARGGAERAQIQLHGCWDLTMSRSEYHEG